MRRPRVARVSSGHLSKSEVTRRFFQSQKTVSVAITVAGARVRAREKRDSPHSAGSAGDRAKSRRDWHVLLPGYGRLFSGREAGERLR